MSDEVRFGMFDEDGRVSLAAILLTHESDVDALCAQFTWIVKMINHIRQFPTFDVFPSLERVAQLGELCADESLLVSANNAPVVAAWRRYAVTDVLVHIGLAVPGYQRKIFDYFQIPRDLCPDVLALALAQWIEVVPVVAIRELLQLNHATCAVVDRQWSVDQLLLCVYLLLKRAHANAIAVVRLVLAKPECEATVLAALCTWYTIREGHDLVCEVLMKVCRMNDRVE